ncbi:MAG: endonuclease MutS2, partial [bacterium]
EDGLVLDSASQELASIRRRRQKTKDAIRSRLDSIMRSSGSILQENLVTIRQGRYVIPIKSEAKRRLKCIVHDVSASGATLFVEPVPVLELNNKLQEIRKSEAEEIRKILAELTRMVRERRDGAVQCVDFLSHLDLLMAKVRFSSEFRCSRPEVNNSGRICIRGGMHPLLIRRKGLGAVVPLDLDLGSDFTTLLISGPNAGGKTLALKTVGILTLLCQCGMHVPASPDSKFSIFKKMYADIGDEQSIERDLSTFSSHITNIAEVVRNADSKTLVLLDEVGVGTDPRSGAGIAMAVLSELTDRGVRTIATSHYGDLKVFVQASKGMSNASVEFDPETLLPTYRLKMGIPGSSNTFEIAERLGLPRELLQTSRKFAREASSRAEEIVASLEKSLARSERLAEETGLERERLKELVSKYEKRLAKIRREEKEARRRRERQAKAMLEKSRSLIENLVREIRESQADSRAIRKAKEALADEMRKHVEPDLRKNLDRELLEPGETVFVEPFRTTGKVISLSRDSVRVELGRVRCEVPISSVTRSRLEETEEHPDPGIPESSGRFELNLRGMNREEALQTLDVHIDRAFMSGLSTVRIIHGKGRGVLRAAIEEALKDDSRVESFREGVPEEGGWGVTVVNLKT